MKVLRALTAKCGELKLKKAFPALKKAFQITSHLTLQERSQLYLLTKNRNRIIEIGSYIGASACCFGAAIKSRADRGQIYCIDTWNNDAMTEGNRDTWQEFQNNTVDYKEYIVPVRGFSTDVIGQVATYVKSVDLLFIDGEHSYEGVKADWNAYNGFLKTGSIVVFHDWGWAEGVKRVILQEVLSHVSDFDTLPNMWWGTIKN